MSEGTIFDESTEKEQPELLWISSTGINKYWWCQFQFYVLYILKYREPTNNNLFFGTVWDETLNYNYSEKVTSDKDLPKNVLQDYFRTQFDAKKDQVDDWGSEDPKNLKEIGTTGVDVFYKDVIPEVRPKIVQPQLSMTFKDKSVILNGKPDLIERAGFVLDNKTASKNKVGGGKEAQYIRQSIQAPLYSLLDSFDNETGQLRKEPQEVRFDMLVKSKKPEVVQPKMVVTAADREATLRLVMQTVEAIRTNLREKNFLPTARYEQGGWKCAYCPVQTVCKETFKFSWMPESKVLAAKDPAKEKQKKAVIQEAEKTALEPVRNIIV